MSELQNLRDKIHRKNGEKFFMKDINPERKQSIYSNIARLVQNNEIARQAGSLRVFKATALLKTRKQAVIKKEEGLDLPGWRDVSPHLFKAPAKGQIYSVL